MTAHPYRLVLTVREGNWLTHFSWPTHALPDAKPDDALLWLMKLEAERMFGFEITGEPIFISGRDINGE